VSGSEINALLVWFLAFFLWGYIAVTDQSVKTALARLGSLLKRVASSSRAAISRKQSGVSSYKPNTELIKKTVQLELELGIEPLPEHIKHLQAKKLLERVVEKNIEYLRNPTGEKPPPVRADDLVEQNSDGTYRVKPSRVANWYSEDQDFPF
jgi:hypothetical protein